MNCICEEIYKQIGELLRTLLSSSSSELLSSQGNTISDAGSFGLNPTTAPGTPSGFINSTSTLMGVFLILALFFMMSTQRGPAQEKVNRNRHNQEF
jgi:preprotein translocase subunit SecG